MKNAITRIDIEIGERVRGKYLISLMSGDKVLMADRIDPYAHNRLQKFVKEAKKKFPMLNADQLETKLLRAAAIDQRRLARGDAGKGNCPYFATDDGLVWRKETSDSVVNIPLTNFRARIVTDTVRDDGAERVRVFTIEAELAGTTCGFKIPALHFKSMNWVLERLGAGAIVHPGNGIHDRACAAIQTLSTDCAIHTVYAHTGWRKVCNDWIYLHHGGAIGATGPVTGLDVELPEALSGYELPAPPVGIDCAPSIQVSLRLLNLGPPDIMFPLFCAIYRAALGDCHFALHLAGQTGVYKSELAALVQQHFGAAMDARHLPANWISTDNFIEGQAFSAKDAIMTIDDYAPSGTRIDVQRLLQKAERVIRGAGNHAGRGRMRPDGTLRPNRPPRCLILSTGEDVPAGHSLRARMLCLEVGPKVINRECLTACQAEARSGLYAASMSGFICWLAGQIDKIRTEFRDKVALYRDRASKSLMHARTPEIVANLAVGMLYFLSFAITAKAINKAQAMEIWTRCWNALGQAAAKQVVLQQGIDPAQRFLDLLSSAFTAGIAHLVRPGVPQIPSTPSAWGWRQRLNGGENTDGNYWHPMGQTVGWLDEEYIYLNPDAAYRAAQAMATAGDGISVSPQTLWKRLDEKKHLIREGNRDELKVRRVVNGAEHRVLCLKRAALLITVPLAHCTNSTFPDAGGGGGDSGNEENNSDVDSSSSCGDGPPAVVSVGIGAG